MQSWPCSSSARPRPPRPGPLLVLRRTTAGTPGSARSSTFRHSASPRRNSSPPPKWFTGSPVDDPLREKQVLATAARQAGEAGADPDTTVRIFRDQIDANKEVQRALHTRWDADSSRAPESSPDLTEVRREINRVSADLVRAIADSAAARAAPSCGGTLTATKALVRRDRHFDRLRAQALTRALGSVCAQGVFWK
ncbi:chorismate mutase [Streptomyces sp. A5-4]|uniref:chorismate mutase n=1 Tax=Streptomyces sp. A5-4 TaxID=3384771 RepID=UPI003DA9846D